jgi:putative transcriptional regulator
MSAPRHHPSEAVLMDYAAGALRPAFAVVVAAHIESCSHCRGSVASLEAAGGALLAELPPSQVAQDRLAQAMAALDVKRPPLPPNDKLTAERIPFGPERRIAPGIGLRKAKISDHGDLLYLLRLPAGVTTVPHGHNGVEFTQVLQGAFDDLGDRYAAGDFAEMTPDIDHQPSVLPVGPCICLIASEKRMRMKSLMGRIVQALTGV